MKEYSCSRSNFEANVASSYDRIIALEHELSDSNKKLQKSEVFIQNLKLALDASKKRNATERVANKTNQTNFLNQFQE